MYCNRMKLQVALVLECYGHQHVSVWSQIRGRGWLSALSVAPLICLCLFEILPLRYRINCFSVQASEGQGSQSSFSIDTDYGYLSVPVSAPARDIYEHIQVGSIMQRLLAPATIYAQISHQNWACDVIAKCLQCLASRVR